MTLPAVPRGYVILSDVHGNLPALEAVLAEAAPLLDQGYLPVTLGDLVGMGPHPAEVVARVAALPGAIHVRGNNDRYVARREYEREVFHRDTYAVPPPGLRENLRWTRERLAPAALRFLEGNPERVEAAFAGRPLLLVHGGPDSDETPLTEMRATEAFAATLPEGAVLVAGHTHHAFVREIAGRLIVNAGGCGSSLDGDPRAAWVVLHEAGGSVAAEIRRSAYDLEAVCRAFAAFAVPWRETVSAILRAAGFPAPPR